MGKASSSGRLKAADNDDDDDDDGIPWCIWNKPSYIYCLFEIVFVKTGFNGAYRVINKVKFKTSHFSRVLVLCTIIHERNRSGKSSANNFAMHCFICIVFVTWTGERLKFIVLVNEWMMWLILLFVLENLWPFKV